MPLSRAVVRPFLGFGASWVVANLLVACGVQGHDYVPPASRPGAAMDAPSPDIVTTDTQPACLDEAPVWEHVDALLEASCRGCHSASRMDEQRLGAPPGVDFDSEAQVRRHGERILARAVLEGTMPPGAALAMCSRTLLNDYLAALQAEPCTTDCDGRSCGDDGCGGSCGDCGQDEACGERGTCEAELCTPDCSWGACGDDGCGGSCGDCPGGLSCNDDHVCVCVPNCDGKACGADGCGDLCGTCSGSELCDQAGHCQCQPQCAGKQCGKDGCGGECGHCSAPQLCDEDTDQCSCTPDCTGKECGEDGCGGDCPAACPSERPICNTETSLCVSTCRPECPQDRVCGDDGCGHACGTCDAGTQCNDAGTACVCVPQCAGKQCGNDGCGDVCGSCTDGLGCNDDGHCVCVPACGGRDCGSDGCGGDCGACGNSETCDDGGQCLCVPQQCTPGSCADDGCGNPCPCEQGKSCDAGTCQWPVVSFANSVYPLFASSCATSLCHDSTTHKASLDLSSVSIAYGELVGPVSTSSMPACMGKTLVQPGDVAGSYLVNKLTGLVICGGRMPRAVAPAVAEPMPESDIDIVRAWIGRGANND